MVTFNHDRPLSISQRLARATGRERNTSNACCPFIKGQQRAGSYRVHRHLSHSRGITYSIRENSSVSDAGGSPEPGRALARLPSECIAQCNAVCAGLLGYSILPLCPPSTKSVSQDDTHNEPLDKQNMCSIKIPAAFLCSAVAVGCTGIGTSRPYAMQKRLPSFRNPHPFLVQFWKKELTGLEVKNRATQTKLCQLPALPKMVEKR